ncbi:MAG: ATP-dependent DNA helicase RecG, partial [Bacteroidales bacterium]|nr:ATP-dependent DNA helicase RecG [Bacteroidales bacterium]
MTKDTSIQYLPGVGPKRAQLLESELGIRTLEDLVHLYPFRYIDRSSIVRIADVHPDLAQVQVRATVQKVRLFAKNGAELPADQLKYNMVSRLSAIVADESGEMEMVFFKGVKWMHARLVPGSTFIFFGKPAVFGSRLNMVHPEVDAPDAGTTGVLTGVYPSTEKLKNAGITGKVMLRLMGTALQEILPVVQETLPDYILKEKGLVPLTYALRQIHFPVDQAAL